jgi:methanogenic corrinoid protein MtbC1
VSGDIHEIGKDLVKLLLRCHGFLVEDLGVDVAPADFLARSLEKNPDVVAMSGLLTITQESMRETVELLRRGWPSERPRITTVIGGGFIDDKVLNYVGADYWAADAMAGVKICQQVVGRRG